MPELSRKLRTLHAAIRELATAEDEAGLFDGLLRALEQVFGRQTAAVLLREPDGEHLRIAASSGYDPEAVSQIRARLGEGVVGRAAKSSKPQLMTELGEESSTPPGVPQARSEMAVPLTVDGEVIGVLDLRSRDHAFGEEDLALLEAFGEQAGWALRHGRAMAMASERARRLALINQAARALNTEHDPDRLLDRILQLATEALGLDNVAVLVVEPGGRYLEVRRALRRIGIEGLTIPVDKGVVGAVFRSGHAELVPDVTADPRYIAGGLAGTRSEMVAPLKVDGEIIGVLDAEGDNIGSFGPLDLEVFSAFAAQVATALRNAQLMRDLANRARRLKQIVRAGRALNSVLDTDEVLGEILDAATSALALERVAVLLSDPGGAELVVRAAKGYRHAVGMRIPIGKGVTGHVASHGEPVLVGNVAEDERYLPGGEGRAAEMAVPLRVQGELLGVLDAESPQQNAFTEHDLDLFRAFADQAAVALNNARLFEDTQQVYYETLKSLARALEARDHYTRGHSERVAELSLAIVREMGLDEAACQLTHKAALLHDIGKIGIRDAVLLKPRPLAAQEMEIIRQHPSFGNLILGPLKFLGEAANLVKHHHERWDGEGYPNGLEGEQIPLPSRVIAVADAFDAMSSSRPYRDARSREEAVDEVRRMASSQFDPAVVEAFLRVIARRAEDPAGWPRPREDSSLPPAAFAPPIEIDLGVPDTEQPGAQDEDENEEG